MLFVNMCFLYAYVLGCVKKNQLDKFYYNNPLLLKYNMGQYSLLSFHTHESHFLCCFVVWRAWNSCTYILRIVYRTVYDTRLKLSSVLQ